MIKKEISRFRSWDATAALTFLICVVILSMTSDVAASPVINFVNPSPTQMVQTQEEHHSIAASSRSHLGQFLHHNDFIKEMMENHGKRHKRSPYPPGFVTWTLKEPCICSPGQLICRCYSTSSTSSEGTQQKSRRRRSRTKKSKSNY